MNEIKKHPAILKNENTALLIVDIQERIISVMRKHESLIENVVKLVKGIKVLNIPIFYTEQYPKGLGPTVKQIKNELNGDAVKKLTFSCSGADNLFERLKNNNIEQIIVCGVESHVCVQQTVFDLLINNFQVNLAVNAVSSRFKVDYETAIKRMEKHGAEITTVESILFELLEVCGTPEFKGVSSLIK
ncbi:MAG: isochorismatase family protein [Ignavibacteriae bacterium]|nr:isochorismatase family protein [Ignavibacteriota bacterium]